MPMEQLAGHPKFSSDVYAVGMFAIQLLTQTHPTRLRQSQRTGEWIWQDKASVNIQFAEFLNRMIRYDFRQRFADAIEALNYLKRLNLNFERFENPVWTENEIFSPNADQRQTQATFFSPAAPLPDNHHNNQPIIQPPVNQPPVNYQAANHQAANYHTVEVEPIFAPQPVLPKPLPARQPIILTPIGAPNLPAQNAAPTRVVTELKLGSGERVEMESVTVGSLAFDGFGENNYLKTLIYAVIIIIASGTLIYTFMGIVQTQQREAQYAQTVPLPPAPNPPPVSIPVKRKPSTKENPGIIRTAMEKEAQAETSDDWYAVAWEWKNAEVFYARVESIATDEQEKETARRDKEFCASKQKAAFQTSESLNMNKKRARQVY
jgi:hypothetical protein